MLKFYMRMMFAGIWIFFRELFYRILYFLTGIDKRDNFINKE